MVKAMSLGKLKVVCLAQCNGKADNMLFFINKEKKVNHYYVLILYQKSQCTAVFHLTHGSSLFSSSFTFSKQAP